MTTETLPVAIAHMQGVFPFQQRKKGECTVVSLSHCQGTCTVPPTRNSSSSENFPSAEAGHSLVTEGTGNSNTHLQVEVLTAMPERQSPHLLK